MFIPKSSKSDSSVLKSLIEDSGKNLFSCALLERKYFLFFLFISAPIFTSCRLDLNEITHSSRFIEVKPSKISSISNTQYPSVCLCRTCQNEEKFSLQNNSQFVIQKRKDETSAKKEKSRELKERIYLRNLLGTRSFTRFKRTVERQARLFPNSFFLESKYKTNKIALTFDDGPNPRWDKKILGILRKNKIKATFFLIGESLERYPDVAREIRDEDHVIGNHSYNHPQFSLFRKEMIYKEQVSRTQDIFYERLGIRPAIIRPPYGAVTDDQIDFMASRGLKIINWSVDTFDWNPRGRNSKKILQKVSSYLHGGAILLMHSGGGDRSSTVKALPEIIEFARKNSYEFVTVPELLEIPAYLETSLAAADTSWK